MLFAMIQFPWPPDNGQKVVSFNDLKSLSKVFEIDVISYIDPINSPRINEYLRELHKRLPDVYFINPVKHQILRGDLLIDKILPFVSGVFHKNPYVVSRYRNPAYIQITNRTLSEKKYDILYIDALNPSYILSEIKSLHQYGLIIIYRMHDAVYETLAAYSIGLGINPTSFATRLDHFISVSYERQLWKRVDFILPVTRQLGDLVVGQMPDLKPKIIYLPVSIELLEQPQKTHDTMQHVLYVGTVHFPPNHLGLKWFLRECWPLVLEKFPKATLDIVGRGGNILLPVHPSVRVHEYTDDLEAFYQTADVFIVPLFAGSGIRLKILEAMNHGLPVISTRTGYAGLELEEKRDIYVADTPSAFAKYICDLFASPVKRETLSSNGRNFVATHHNINNAMNTIEDLLSRLQGG